MDYIQIEQDLIDDHGIWLRARKTGLGHLTIGVGYCGREIKATSEMSLERAGALLAQGIDKALINVVSTFGRVFFDNLSGPRQRTLICIAFNGALESMAEFIHAVKEHDWERASLEYMKTGHSRMMPRRAERIRIALLGTEI